MRSVLKLGQSSGSCSMNSRFRHCELDDALCTSWAHLEDWYGVKLEVVVELGGNTDADRLDLGLLTWSSKWVYPRRGVTDSWHGPFGFHHSFCRHPIGRLGTRSAKRGRSSSAQRARREMAHHYCDYHSWVGRGLWQETSNKQVVSRLLCPCFGEFTGSKIERLQPSSVPEEAVPASKTSLPQATCTRSVALNRIPPPFGNAKW